MDKEVAKALAQAAWDARRFSYCPYSGYQVGAALLTKGGQIYTGCNIESASYSPTNCAERTALFKAVSQGEREFAAIAVCGGNADGSPDGGDGYAAPCGVCRQMLLEFCSPEDFVILLVKDLEHGLRTYTLGELLPHGFGPGMLKKG